MPLDQTVAGVVAVLLRVLPSREDVVCIIPSFQAPGGSVRGERANFTKLVLGCIEAKFRRVLPGGPAPGGEGLRPLSLFNRRELTRPLDGV